MSDSDSESGEGSFAPNQALPVANLPWNYDGTPQDGLEYLFTVRRDSRLLPRYTRVENPFPSVEAPKIASGVKTTPSTSRSLPSEEWRTTFVARFRNYRQNLRRSLKEVAPSAETSDGHPHYLPKFDRETWWKYISGTGLEETSAPVHREEHKAEGANETEPFRQDSPEESAVARASDTRKEQGGPRADVIEPSVSRRGHEPSLWVLKRLSTRNNVQLLYWHSVWIDTFIDVLQSGTNGASFGGSTASILAPHSTQKEATSRSVRRLTPVHQRWMFCLLGVLDDNLIGDDISTLRILARACLRLIVAYSTSTTTEGSAKDPNDPLPLPDPEAKHPSGWAEGVGGYWMVIAAIVGVWGQLDLWDEARRSLS